MNDSRTQYPGLIDRFAGENRTLPEHVLPPNVSPEAINIDYRDGTLKPRPGYQRFRRWPLYTGGIRVGDPRNSVNRYASITHGGSMAFAAGTSWNVVLYFRPKWSSIASGTNQETLLFRQSNLTSQGSYLVIRENGSGQYRLRWYIFHNGPGFIAVDSTVNLVSGTDYAVRLEFDAGSAPKRGRIHLWTRTGATLPYALAATDPTTFPGAESYTASTADIVLGSNSLTYAATSMVESVIDEFGVFRNTAEPFIGNEYHPPLLRTGVIGDIVLIYSFNDWPNVVKTWGFATSAITLNATRPGPGLVPGRTNVTTPSAIVPIKTADTQDHCLVFVDNDILKMTYADGAFTELTSTPSKTTSRWCSAAFREWTLLSNGEEENFKYHPSSGIRQLSYRAPSGTVPNITAAAGTSSFGATGSYSYLFTFVDSTTGQESQSGLLVSQSIAGTTEEIRIGTTGVQLPFTRQVGVDTVRIYRRDPSTTTFFALKDLAIGTASYTDTNTGTAGDGTLDSLRPLDDAQRGYAEPSVVTFEHNGSIFCCNQSGNRQRIRFSVPGSLGDFPSDYFIYAGRGDGDPITGAVVFNGVPVIFKRNSIWFLTGTGPSTYRAVRMAGYGVGAVHAAAITETPAGVLFMSSGGVYALTSLESVPQDITANSQRPIFEEMTEDTRRGTSAAYDATTDRYYLSFDYNFTERQTLVLDFKTQAWMLWDLPATCWAVAFPDGAESKVLAGVPGYVVWHHEQFKNDGADWLNSGVTHTLEWPLFESTIESSAATLRTVFVQTTTSGEAAALSARYLLVPFLVYRPSTGEYVKHSLIWFDEGMISAPGVARIPFYESEHNWTQASGDVVIIGGIACYWRTPLFAIDGNPHEPKAYNRLRMLFESGNSDRVRATLSGESETAFTLAATTRSHDRVVKTRGAEVSLQLAHVSASQDFALAAFSVGGQDRGTRS